MNAFFLAFVKGSFAEPPDAELQNFFALSVCFG